MAGFFSYYMIHIFLIHLGALFAATLTGYPWTSMTGFTNWVVFYLFCRRYDRYKLEHKDKWWLSYL